MKEKTSFISSHMPTRLADGLGLGSILLLRNSPLITRFPRIYFTIDLGVVTALFRWFSYALL